MNTIVIEHVALNDLPAAWRSRLPRMQGQRVTVRIEEEAESAAPAISSPLTDNPLFGLWQDREDMQDVAAYAHQLRTPRF